MATYNKPHLTLSQQVELLVSRGMSVPDRAAAERCLSTVGYYRLSGYWYPYRQIAGEPPTRADQFINGTTLAQVVALYEFDRRLKMLTLDAIERIEVAMRFRTGYVLGRRGAYAHDDPANFDAAFSRRYARAPSKYDGWKDKLAVAQARSKEDFVTHFNTKYDGRLPVWVATELLDFGGLSFLYEGMTRADRDDIAADLAIVDANRIGNGRALANWLRVLNFIRNTCAHHSRLWNRNLVDQLATRQLRPLPALAHLAARDTEHQNARPFAAFCVIAYLLTQVAENPSFASQVRALIEDQLPSTGRAAQEMGFPDGWTELSLWREQ